MEKTAPKKPIVVDLNGEVQEVDDLQKAIDHALLMVSLTPRPKRGTFAEKQNQYWQHLYTKLTEL